MQENFLITIKGTMEQRGDSDTVELMTRGSLVHKEGAYYIVYKETEATGYEGCTTTVKVAEDARKVSMLRYGKVPSQLIVEKGTRHLCHYEQYKRMLLLIKTAESRQRAEKTDAKRRGV